MPRKRRVPQKSAIPSLRAPEGKAKVIREKARASFDTARMGYLDWIDRDPLRESMGLYNAIVFGWAALTILGKMNSIYREKFSAWYDPIMEKFRADPLLGWYIELRNEVLKEGAPGRDPES
jgi:hypothetical protein